MLSVIWVVFTGLFAVAALNAAVSVHAPSRSRATSVSMCLFLAWIDLPLITEFLFLRVGPGCPRWFVQLIRWLVDSNPVDVLAGHRNRFTTALTADRLYR